MANLKHMNNEMAVSPIVATLVLIVVAVIGAVAVGTIMGTFSTDVSKQASASQASSASQTEILIAGSTTLLPAELNLQSDFQKANPGYQLNVQGGGSGAGVSSVAMGISDIGAASSASNILTAQTNNPSDPNYQNLYYTQIGGRGVVFITNKATPAVSPAAQTGGVHTADLVFAFTNANVLNGKTTAASTGGDVLINTVVEQRESGSGTENTVNSYLGTSMPIANAGTNNGNAAELSLVQTTPSALGYVDAGYAITGGVASTTPASGIIILNVTDSSSGSPVTYVPSHANIKNSLKDWYYQHAQDNTGGSAKNYPQGLVGGLYWITKGTAPTASTNGIVTTPGTSSAARLLPT